MAQDNKDFHDFLFKFIIIGDAGSGKSCLLHQFIEKRAKEVSSHTIGVEFGSKIIDVGGRSIKLQMWDTAGQERYRSVTRSYYRGAAGALLVFDVTHRDSFNHLANWLADARSLARMDISIIVVGNKSDLKDRRQVSFLEASGYAQENGILFLETSAITGDGVEEVFSKVARVVLNKIEEGLIEESTMVSGIHAGTQRLRDGGSDTAILAKACASC